jgi:hypothetical protein
LSEAKIPIPPPLHTHCIRVYSITYSHKEGGRGGRVEPEIRVEVKQFTKLGRK